MRFVTAEVAEGAAAIPHVSPHIAIEGTLAAEDYFTCWRDLERAIPGRVVEIIERAVSSTSPSEYARQEN